MYILVTVLHEICLCFAVDNQYYDWTSPCSSYYGCDPLVIPSGNLEMIEVSHLEDLEITQHIRGRSERLWREREAGERV